MSFCIEILLARINARLQALLRKRYPFGKQKGEKGKETFGKQPSVNIRVVTKWYAKVPPANFCHRKPTDVPEMSLISILCIALLPHYGDSSGAILEVPFKALLHLCSC